MTLNAKVLLFFSALMGLLMVLLIAISLYSFRQFSLYTAERHARSVAESIKVGLTESMVNGTIGKRPEFLERLNGVPGVQGVRVIRGPAVSKQFGPGLAQESAASAKETEVISRGAAAFQVEERNGELVFHAIIPYTASSLGTPNCLQCHLVTHGTVLGAVAIDIPLHEVKRQALFTVGMVVTLVLLTGALSLLLLRRLLRPLVETTHSVNTVVTQAVGGTFSGRIEQRTSDEVGEIAGHLNRLMGFLDEGISTISRRISELMGGFHHQNTGNQLVTATEMVEGLVEAAQFKQAIEEDQSKPEVYQRLARVLNDKYDFHQFSIYEVSSSKNRVTPIIVDNEIGAPCRWCDQQILIDASACRVKRTGHAVNAVDFPGICTMFRNDDPTEERTHICLPMSQSGSVGCVVQMVFTPDQGQFAKLLVPFIAVYLREAGPVLEAKRLM
ncbi:MAG: diguanylate cyclase, partial [Sulfuricella sp.]|nr:diguanylate cyclase [Sulfuricella sp.]